MRNSFRISEIKTKIGKTSWFIYVFCTSWKHEIVLPIKTKTISHWYLVKNIWAFQFSFFVDFGWRSYEKPEYFLICLFTFFKSQARLALQMKAIIRKIMQPKLPKRKNEVTQIFNEPVNRINFGSIEETMDLSCIL